MKKTLGRLLAALLLASVPWVSPAKSLLPVHTFLIPLKRVSIEAATATLTPLLSKRGRITSDATANALLIQDHAQELNRIRAVAEALERGGTGGFVVLSDLVHERRRTLEEPVDPRPAVEDRLPRIGDCFRKALRDHPGATGFLLVTLTVGEGGRITSGELRSRTLTDLDGRHEDCLLGEVTAIAFPMVPSGRQVTLELTFVP